MAEDTKNGPSSALVPKGANVFEDVEKSLELKLRGVQGSVKSAIIEQMRKMVDKDPKVFVSNLRRLTAVHHED